MRRAYYEAWIFPLLTKSFKIKETALSFAEKSSKNVAWPPNIQFSTGVNVL